MCNQHAAYFQQAALFNHSQFELDLRPFLYNRKIYFCSDWTACEQLLSTLSCATHAHTKNLLDRCAQSIYQRIAQEKLYKICKNGPVLSSSFCTMWAKQQNNQSISPRNNRTPSTFYNAGKYFESDWDNNLITTKPYTLWVRRYTQTAVLSQILLARLLFAF